MHLCFHGDIYVGGLSMIFYFKNIPLAMSKPSLEQQYITAKNVIELNSWVGPTMNRKI